MIGSLILTEIVCCDCTAHFAMDSDLNRRCLDTGRSFYCPNGHGQSYTDTELSKLKKERKNLLDRVSWAETEAENAKRERTALKSKLTKTKNRIANGVCPCCNRTFANVGRHMTTKHPDFKEVVSS